MDTERREGIKDCDVLSEIKSMFEENKAWAYTTMYHGVAIGIWDGEQLQFHTSAGFCVEDIIELRVFDEKKELRVVSDEYGKLICRNSEIYKDDESDSEKYLMYGTKQVSLEENDQNKNWIALEEDRGKELYFPKMKSLVFVNDEVYMWLCIRNYLRFSDDLRLEVVDYAFAGFRTGKDKKGVVKIDEKG